MSNLKVVPQWVVTLHHEATKSFVIALKFFWHHNIYDRHHTMTTSSSSSSHTQYPPSPKLTQPPLSLGSQSQRVCLEFALFFAYDLKDVAFTDFIWKLDEIQPDASLNFLSKLASFLLQHGAAHLPDQEHHQHQHHHHHIDEEHHDDYHHIMNLRLLTPKSFAESRQAALRAGYSPGVKHSNDFKLPRILPSKIKHGHFL